MSKIDNNSPKKQKVTPMSTTIYTEITIFWIHILHSIRKFKEYLIMWKEKITIIGKVIVTKSCKIFYISTTKKEKKSLELVVFLKSQEWNWYVPFSNQPRVFSLGNDWRWRSKETYFFMSFSYVTLRGISPDMKLNSIWQPWQTSKICTKDNYITVSISKHPILEFYTHIYTYTDIKKDIFI